MFKYSLFLYLLSAASILHADPLYFESGTKQNTLVELYTSEGCSSCPPAEKFLNNLNNNTQLWKTLYPVAFHVDYWDYLGWKDVFANKYFAERQTRYARLKKVTTVYTPAFIVNGRSWRPGFFSDELPAINKMAGNLVVAIDEKIIKASYQRSGSENQELKLNVAVLGMALKSNIARGENAGRNARHEFVVVGFGSAVSPDARWKMQIPALHYLKAKKYAVVAWVSTVNEPTPLQVTGGTLPKY